ncbi:MAG: hypothetical protein ACN6O3_00280 [Comamonas sp.]
MRSVVKKKALIAAAVGVIGAAIGVAALYLRPDVPAHIAIFAPAGINPEFVGKVAGTHINTGEPDHMERQLQKVVGSSTKVDLDLGPVLNRIRPVAQLNTEYGMGDQRQRKLFAPLALNKLRDIPPDPEAIAILRPYMELIQRYQDHVATVFVADEPYLNGISKAELERMAKTLRALFAEYQIRDVKLGVIFASGMANADFAQLLDREAGQYVRNIDQYYQALSEKAQAGTAAPDELQWLQHIEKHRLTTYDSAGNMYVGGGLPQGYDVFGFDFYLSTVLQDGLYENALPELQKHAPRGACEIEKFSKISQLRAQLSFYQDGPIVPASTANGQASTEDPRDKDRRLLDQLYQCRMAAATNMLRKEIAKVGGKGKIIVVTESSNNGVLEFDSKQNIEPGQPQLLIESRVLDEVRRALAFYGKERKRGDIEALEFFTFDNTYDNTINLHIGGFVDMPSVKAEIFQASRQMMCQGKAAAQAACQ